ncbi:MAG: HAMP domain-containing histidine kinase, partial [Oscillospiraceae bacterium]|nr:HAMP domain-containing histidine kinase [Oscillospiraceae bacterium]
VSNASHELKTPLASIKLLTDSILQNDMDADTVQEFVTDIGNEADRLTRLSEKLLELTRLDTQPVEKHETVEVLPVAARVVKMLTPLAHKQGVQLKLNCSAECAICGTADDLYQILFNLVENGIKYNQEGGWVLLQAYKEDNMIQIGVEDTGVGIPDKERSHIFERFYRVDKARSRKAGGVGLGLSIVHDMVLRNNGTISVKDGPIGGTRFNLSFFAIPVPRREKKT